MKMIFAAVASTLLVSTAFAQTAAPAMSNGQHTQAAGEANLKADASAQPDAAKPDTSAKHVGTTTDKSEAKVHGQKTAAAHTVKTRTHKVSKTKHSVASGADKSTSKADAGKMPGKKADSVAAKTDGAKTDTTQTN